MGKKSKRIFDPSRLEAIAEVDEPRNNEIGICGLLTSTQAAIIVKDTNNITVKRDRWITCAVMEIESLDRIVLRDLNGGRFAVKIALTTPNNGANWNITACNKLRQFVTETGLCCHANF